MELQKEFVRFLKKPEINPPVSLSFKQSIILFIKCIPIYFIFIFICILLFIPLSIFDLVPETHKRTMSDAFELIVLAPVLEELFFRFPLRNFFRNLFLSIALLVYALSKTFLGIPMAIVVAVLVAVLPYIPGFINRHEFEVNKFIDKYYPHFFYLVAFIFGFIHMDNLINPSVGHYFVSPIIVLYQILMGLLMGFVRVKYKWGIIYAILFHSVFNAIPVLIKLL